jgi:hypothetical protein
MIESYKDLHKGQRAFVLGCGGSLEHTPLHMIADEISFGMNNIRLIYPFTRWRPTYYYNSTTCVEKYPHWLKCADETVDDGTTCFVRNKSPIKHAPNVVRFTYHVLTDGGIWLSGWSKDLTNGIVHFKMSLYGLMQLVLYMGFSEVYLMGFDNDFKVGHNHFVDDYEGEFVWTEETAEHQRYWQGYAHKVIKNYTDNLGVSVIDCTVGGLLNVYPKARLEDVV